MELAELGCVCKFGTLENHARLMTRERERERGRASERGRGSTENVQIPNGGGGTDTTDTTDSRTQCASCTREWGLDDVGRRRRGRRRGRRRAVVRSTFVVVRCGTRIWDTAHICRVIDVVIHAQRKRYNLNNTLI